MPSINEVQRLFLKQVVPEQRNWACDREWWDENIQDNLNYDQIKSICDEMKVMLICAYIELILPIFTIGGSFLFKKDAKHIWGSNLPGLGCITGGSIFLALYYGGKNPINIYIHLETNFKIAKICQSIRICCSKLMLELPLPCVSLVLYLSFKLLCHSLVS